MDPEVLNAISQVAVALIGLVVAVLGAYLGPTYKLAGKLQIEEKHRKALHSAAATYAENAIRQGIDVANAEFVDDFMQYARESIPDALDFFQPTIRVASDIVRRYLPSGGGVTTAISYDDPPTELMGS